MSGFIKKALSSIPLAINPVSSTGSLVRTPFSVYPAYAPVSFMIVLRKFATQWYALPCPVLFPRELRA